MEEAAAINTFELVRAGLAKPRLACLATMTADQRPWVRYVMLSADQDLNLFVATFKNSRKVQQIEKNPEVHLAVDVELPDFPKQYLQIEAIASVSEAIELKTKLWTESMQAYFSGPEDDKLTIIVMRPYRIELYDMRSMEPSIWESEGADA
ncbi:MAG: pyridoxamine 5'-phosphate oxidase family protein [Myxococcota bacterium]|jgi:general stress protein 26|nr:pyridoxamine 5'-phosphate oxidase family protein [Myxococcota bacterium]